MEILEGGDLLLLGFYALCQLQVYHINIVDIGDFKLWLLDAFVCLLPLFHKWRFDFYV